MSERVLHVVVPSSRNLWDYRFALSYANMQIEFVREANTNPELSGVAMYCYCIPNTFIADARNKAAEFALEGNQQNGMPPADYLLMIDDDMVVPPGAISKLLSHNLPVVAPLFHHRMPPFRAVMFMEVPEDKKTDTFQYKLEPPREPLQEVDAVGFGMVLLDVKRTLRKMNRPFFWMGYEFGEDVYFCHKAKHEAKARIYVDTTIDVGHIGVPPVIVRAVAEKLQEHDDEE
jgi:glycosyltransferase involved in cell wall biosynthesis